MKVSEQTSSTSEKNVDIGQVLAFEEAMGNEMKGRVTLVGRGFDKNGEYLDGEILHKQNLILNGAREIMRDVMFGGSGIEKVVFGDLGLGDQSTTAELINVPAPSETDLKLVRQVGEKALGTATQTKIGKGTTINPSGRAGIKYEITLEKTDLVPVGQNQQFILEMGLATADDKLFSRITHPVIIKTKSLQITLIWEILF